MFLILFCNFLLVLDISGPPREINSCLFFDSVNADTPEWCAVQLEVPRCRYGEFA